MNTKGHDDVGGSSAMKNQLDYEPKRTGGESVPIGCQTAILIMFLTAASLGLAFKYMLDEPYHVPVGSFFFELIVIPSVLNLATCAIAVSLWRSIRRGLLPRSWAPVFVWLLADIGAQSVHYAQLSRSDQGVLTIPETR